VDEVGDAGAMAVRWGQATRSRSETAAAVRLSAARGDGARAARKRGGRRRAGVVGPGGRARLCRGRHADRPAPPALKPRQRPGYPRAP
jgi:hypothetical protein